MKTTNLVWLAVVFALAGGVWYVSEKSGSTRPPATPATTTAAPAAVISTDGKQVFEIVVKEGYQPSEITAKAGVPVILKMKTQGTFDCSNVFTIPKLGLRMQLQPTGEALIEIPAQKAGDSVYGVCGMGMDTLVIKFI
jgi:heme/copper-type cytochrome/quinol oxidase subunit 2